MRIEPALVWALLLGACAFAAAGCPGTLENKLAFVSGDAGTCGDVPTTIFQPTCGKSTCHDATNPAQGLDLVSPGVAARVIGQPATGACNGDLADPVTPEDSILYLKLLPGPPCGAQMPLGAAKLDDGAIACVKAWIAAQTLPGSGGGGGSAGAGGSGGSAGAGGAGGGGGTGGAGGGAAGAGGAGGAAGGT